MAKSSAAQTRARNKKMVSDAQASTRGSTSNRLVKDLEFLKFSLDRLQADRKRSAIKTQRIKNKKLEIKLIEEELANRKRVEERRARRIKNEEYFERVAPRDPELKRMIAIEKRDAEKALRERDVYGRNFRRRGM